MTQRLSSIYEKEKQAVEGVKNYINERESLLSNRLMIKDIDSEERKKMYESLNTEEENSSLLNYLSQLVIQYDNLTKSILRLSKNKKNLVQKINNLFEKYSTQ